MLTRLLKHADEQRSDGSEEQTSDLPSGELERRKLLAKLTEFVAGSDLSIPKIAHLMGVSDRTLTAWISGTARAQRNKLLEIRRFLDSHGS